MDNTSKSILMQVSFKAQIEREKRGWFEFFKKKLTRKEFEDSMQKDYDSLYRLIIGVQQSDELASNNDISTLEALIDSSTLDHDQRAETTLELTSTLTHGRYIKLRDGLLMNQLPATDDLTGKTQFKLNKELKKQNK